MNVIKQKEANLQREIRKLKRERDNYLRRAEKAEKEVLKLSWSFDEIIEGLSKEIERLKDRLAEKTGTNDIAKGM